VVVQPATIPTAPLERPPVPNHYRRAAPEDFLSNTLHLLGLQGALIDMMRASNMLRGNSGSGSVRPPPDGPLKTAFWPFPLWELFPEFPGLDAGRTKLYGASMSRTPEQYVLKKRVIFKQWVSFVNYNGRREPAPVFSSMEGQMRPIVLGLKEISLHRRKAQNGELPETKRSWASGRGIP
jgi:hypothetical protein